jgi:hypothetical protein
VYGKNYLLQSKNLKQNEASELVEGDIVVIRRQKLVALERSRLQEIRADL